MSNTALWESLFKTDPAHTKKFQRTGGFSGTAIKPYWMIKRLTETFGAVGIGWGWDIIEEQRYDAPNGEVLWMAKASIWYVQNGQKFHTPQQWGQTRLYEQRRDKSFFLDEEAPKKSVTDAVTKCASYLGLGGDVHMGLFDDSKYVADMAEAKNPTKAEVQKELDRTKKDAPQKPAGPLYTLNDDSGGISPFTTPDAFLDGLGRLLKDTADPIDIWTRNEKTIESIRYVAEQAKNDKLVGRVDAAYKFANTKAAELNP